MRNCSYFKAILKKSQTKGSRTQSMGASPSPSSSFPPFFKGPGAGVTDSPGSITSAIFIHTNTNARHQHRGIIRSHVE